MHGTFMRNPLGTVFMVLGLVSGPLLAAIFAAALILDPEFRAEPMGGVMFVLAGLLVFGGSLAQLLEGRKKTFLVTETEIIWRLPFQRRTVRPISQLAAVEWNPYDWSLILEFQDHASYVIPSLKNADDLCAYLRNRLSAENMAPAPGKSAALRQELTALLQKKRLLLPRVLLSLAAVIVCIAFVGYTLDRDGFSSIPLRRLLALSCAGVALLILLFYSAAQMGKLNRRLPGLLSQLREAVLIETPLPAGDALRVLSDGDYTLRVTVLADAPAQYQAVLEILSADFHLETAERTQGATPEDCLARLSCSFTPVDLSPRLLSK